MRVIAPYGSGGVAAPIGSFANQLQALQRNQADLLKQLGQTEQSKNEQLQAAQVQLERINLRIQILQAQQAQAGLNPLPTFQPPTPAGNENATAPEAGESLGTHIDTLA